MNLIKCEKCGTEVLLNSNNSCPRCHWVQGVPSATDDTESPLSLIECEECGTGIHEIAGSHCPGCRPVRQPENKWTPEKREAFRRWDPEKFNRRRFWAGIAILAIIVAILYWLGILPIEIPRDQIELGDKRRR